MISLNIADYQPQKRYEYVLASNGLFLIKSNDVFRAIVPVGPEELKLQPMTETLELIGTIRVPFVWVHRAVEFFREVNRRYRAEAFLLILLDQASDQITLGCPKQDNSLSHVHAEPDSDIPDDLLRIGDIHSHPCTAFHSAGDVEDELGADGIHVVVGNLQLPVPQFTASLVVKGRRKPLAPADVLELDFEFDLAWLDKVNVQ